jgi:hypothetical protein
VAECVVATMEPAVGQRELGMHKVMTGVTDDVPQWSPPSTGGSMPQTHVGSGSSLCLPQCRPS